MRQSFTRVAAMSFKHSFMLAAAMSFKHSFMLAAATEPISAVFARRLERISQQRTYSMADKIEGRYVCMYVCLYVCSIRLFYVHLNTWISAVL